MLKTLFLFFSILLLSTNAFADSFTGGMQGGYKAMRGGMLGSLNPTKQIIADNPDGLTFAENYQGATDVKSMYADYSVGSGAYTYTSTSGTPTFTANGYSATTANADVLKYAISGNRTAAQETLAIKFMPSSDFENTGVQRRLLDTDTSRRQFEKSGTGIKLLLDENNLRIASSTTTPLGNISYVATGIIRQSGNPNKEIYINGTLEGSENTDMTDTFGTYFYIGSNITGIHQLNGSIAWVKIFNRALTASEIATQQ